MTTRPTKIITTPNGLTVVLNTYLTGREADDVKNALFSSLKLNVSQDGTAPQSISADVVLEQQKRTMKYLLVSVDGNSENPLDVLLDGPASEYEAVVKAVNEIANPTLPSKSNTPGDDTSTAVS